jgi:hypothetical protein
MRFETGNFIVHSITGRGELVYEKLYGFTLEALDLVEPEDTTDFLSTRLNASDTYFHTTVYKFSTL